MVRTFAIVMLALVVLAGAAAGYIAGAQTIDRRSIDVDQTKAEAPVRAFYAALGESGDDRADLDAMLAPEFTEQQVELHQTLDRATFLQTVAQERTTFPGRQLAPVQIAFDGNWAMVTLQTVDAGPGGFASIGVEPSSSIRREMLEIVDGRIVERVVLEGAASSLRSLPAAQMAFEGVGMQTIEVARKDFAPHALERAELAEPALLVVEVGRLDIEAPGTGGFFAGPGERLVVAAPGTLQIENSTNAPAALLMLQLVPVGTPRSIPEQPQGADPGPGVTARRVAQSVPFLPGTACLAIQTGIAILAPGERLPAHVTHGFEIVIPTGGAIEASSEDREFLRTDSARLWQDEIGFARLEPGISVVAPPGSRTTYAVAGDEPVRFWIFSVEVGDQPCASPAT